MKGFSKEADFSYSKFLGEANFDRYGFGGYASFKGVRSASTVHFNACRLHGELAWQWVEPEQNRNAEGNQIARGLLKFADIVFETNGLLDLRRNPLADDCRIKLENCDMSRVLLEGTNCTRIAFRDNRWPEADDRLFGFIRAKRRVVGDELRARAGGAKAVHTEINFVSIQEPDSPKPIIFDSPPELPWRLVEITYQQLARRFREDFNHPLANEFDRGVFEVRRQHHQENMGWWPWEKFRHKSQYLWISAYKYASHYSGNLLLPLAWSAVVILIFAFLYGALDPYHSWFQPYLVFSGSDVDWRHVWAMFALSVRSALALSPAGGTADGLPLGEGHLTLQAIERVLSALFITLFIFTIRRRFRH